VIRGADLYVHNDALGTIRLTFTAEQVSDYLAAAD
jgi:hypothetical protein